MASKVPSLKDALDKFLKALAAAPGEELKRLAPELRKASESVGTRLAENGITLTDFAKLASPQKKRRLLPAEEKDVDEEKDKDAGEDSDDDVDGRLAKLMEIDSKWGEVSEDEEEDDEDEDDEEEEEEEDDDDEIEEEEAKKRDEGIEETGGACGECEEAEPAGAEELEEDEDASFFVSKRLFKELQARVGSSKAVTQKMLIQLFDDDTLPEGEALLSLDTSAIQSWPAGEPGGGKAACKKLIDKVGVKAAAHFVVDAGAEALDAEEEGEEEEEGEDDPAVD